MKLFYASTLLVLFTVCTAELLAGKDSHGGHNVHAAHGAHSTHGAQQQSSGYDASPGASPTQSYNAPSKPATAPATGYSAPKPDNSYKAPSQGYSASSGQPTQGYGASNEGQKGQTDSGGYYYYYYPVKDDNSGYNKGNSHHQSSGGYDSGVNQYHSGSGSGSGSGYGDVDYFGGFDISTIVIVSVLLLGVAFLFPTIIDATDSLRSSRSFKNIVESVSEEDINRLTAFAHQAFNKYMGQ